MSRFERLGELFSLFSIRFYPLEQLLPDFISLVHCLHLVNLLYDLELPLEIVFVNASNDLGCYSLVTNPG